MPDKISICLIKYNGWAKDYRGSNTTIRSYGKYLHGDWIAIMSYNECMKESDK